MTQIIILIIIGNVGIYVKKILEGGYMEEQKNEQQEQEVSQQQVREIQNQLSTVRTFTNGARVFYWITGLSILNSLIFFFGGDIQFVMGLGITMLSDGLISVFTHEANILQLVASVLLSGIYVICGYYAGKRYKAAFIIGMILYFIDAFIFLIFKDFWSILFHIVLLYEAFQGYRACKVIDKWGTDESANN